MIFDAFITYRCCLFTSPLGAWGDARGLRRQTGDWVKNFMILDAFEPTVAASLHPL